MDSQEIPACHETKRIVDPMTGKTDETTRYGEGDGHLGDAVIDQTDDTGVESVGDEQIGGATLVESISDRDLGTVSIGRARRR